MTVKSHDQLPGTRAIRIAAAVTVVGLAGIAAAISYSHMRYLAEQHGEHGWRAHCFPLSVDGIEIVASLVLLYHRRAGTRAGVLPWVALAAGTLASLAANVAVGATDLVGRAVAGWPAIALLVAVKLLAGLIDGAGHEPSPRTGTPAASVAAPDLAVRDGRPAWSPARSNVRRSGPRSTAPRPRRTDGPDLEAAARTAVAALSASGERLTRDTLTRALRGGGHTVSNARAGELLTMLRTVPSAPVNGTRPGLDTVDPGRSDA